jgi:hypothetical protein
VGAHRCSTRIPTATGTLWSAASTCSNNTGRSLPTTTNSGAQFLRYLGFAYLSGEVSIGGVQHVLEKEIFTNEENRIWWAAIRDAWAADLDGDPKYEKLIDAINSSWLRTAPPSSGPSST